MPPTQHTGRLIHGIKQNSPLNNSYCLFISETAQPWTKRERVLRDSMGAREVCVYFEIWDHPFSIRILIFLLRTGPRFDILLLPPLAAPLVLRPATRKQWPGERRVVPHWT